jgi:fatty-acid desaturase
MALSFPLVIDGYSTPRIIHDRKTYSSLKNTVFMVCNVVYFGASPKIPKYISPTFSLHSALLVTCSVYFSILKMEVMYLFEKLSSLRLYKPDTCLEHFTKIFLQCYVKFVWNCSKSSFYNSYFFLL